MRVMFRGRDRASEGRFRIRMRRFVVVAMHRCLNGRMCFRRACGIWERVRRAEEQSVGFHLSSGLLFVLKLGTERNSRGC